jgi:electron transfer flavoprotein beta subunit
VCIKQVPVSDTRIKITDPAAGIDMAEVKLELNPYDEFALEEAVRLKEQGKATEVIVFTVAGADAEPRLRDALARGADKAVRLDDAAFAGSDSLGISRILAAALKAEGVQLVLAGKQAIDDDNAAVPSMLAEMLDWNGAMVVSKLEIDKGSFKAWRAAGGGAREVVVGSLPAVISTDKGLNTPRFASLPNIMKAKKKPIEVKNAAALGLVAGQVGAAGALVKAASWGLPAARPAGRILKGDSKTVVKELVQLLRNEAKVI